MMHAAPWWAALAVLAWVSAARADGPAPDVPLVPDVPLAPDVPPTPAVATSTPGGARMSAAALAAPPPPAARPGSGRYYGYQTLLVHAGAIAAGAAGAAAFEDDATPVIVGASLVNTFAPALIHALHDQPTNALASLGANLGLPTAGGLLGLGVSFLFPAEGDLGRLVEVVVGMAIGAGVGGLAAMVLDATWLGFEDEASPAVTAVVPSVTRSPRGAPVVGFAVAL